MSDLSQITEFVNMATHLNTTPSDWAMQTDDLNCDLSNRQYSSPIIEFYHETESYMSSGGQQPLSEIGSSPESFCVSPAELHSLSCSDDAMDDVAVQRATDSVTPPVHDADVMFTNPSGLALTSGNSSIPPSPVSSLGDEEFSVCRLGSGSPGAYGDLGTMAPSSLVAASPAFASSSAFTTSAPASPSQKRKHHSPATSSVQRDATMDASMPSSRCACDWFGDSSSADAYGDKEDGVVAVYDCEHSDEGYLHYGRSTKRTKFDTSYGPSQAAHRRMARGNAPAPGFPTTALLGSPFTGDVEQVETGMSALLPRFGIPTGSAMTKWRTAKAGAVAAFASAPTSSTSAKGKKKNPSKATGERFYCQYCPTSCSRLVDLWRHQGTAKRCPAPKIPFPCKLCGAVITRKDALQRHWNSKHGKDPLPEELQYQREYARHQGSTCTSKK